MNYRTPFACRSLVKSAAIEYEVGFSNLDGDLSLKFFDRGVEVFIAGLPSVCSRLPEGKLRVAREWSRVLLGEPENIPSRLRPGRETITVATVECFRRGRCAGKRFLLLSALSPEGFEAAQSFACLALEVAPKLAGSGLRWAAPGFSKSVLGPGSCDDLAAGEELD